MSTKSLNICKYIVFISACFAVIIMVLIFRHANQSEEETFADSESINTVKNNLLAIQTLKNQIYSIPPSNVSTDVGSDLILEDVGNLNAEFQLKFIQQLQDAEIDNLKDQLKNMPDVPELNANRPVKSIKHLGTGRLFSVLKHPEQSGSQFSVVVDPDNATCLKYNAGYPDDANIDLTACDINYVAPDQKFILETITNNKEFNEMLSPDFAERYAVSPDFGFGAYPFSVIRPVIKNANGIYNTAATECMTLGSGGLSVEPCTGKESQRFTPLDIDVKLGL
jgi:hypothetical protein